MTEPADDDDLDSMMGSMRGMFRDLPDEEPPMRGFDALMAAARTKAAEMAPPPPQESWLRRALAMLTRPPVLAAATAVLLVGSTVMLTRKSGMENVAATERRPTFEDGEAAKESGAAKPQTEQLKKGKQREAEKDAPSFDTPTVAPSEPKPPGGRPVPRPAVVRPPEKPRDDVRPPPKHVDEDLDQQPKNELGEGGSPAGQTGTGIIKTIEVNKAPSIDSTTTDRPTAAKPPTAAPQTVSVDQLVKQAEVAAGRNDCAAVKVTAAKIRQLDKNAYRSRVVSTPAIKRCLDPRTVSDQ